MPRPFDLEWLQALMTVAEAGSLSAAAPRLFRSQSAVSEQIRKLEETCGAELFVRGKSGVRLTPSGEKLLAHARRMLAMSDAAYRDVHGARLSGELRFAVTDYFRPRVLPGLLRRVREEFAGLTLRVAITKSARIEEEVETDAFDIGLSMTILHDGAARREEDGRIRLRREPLMWVADKTFVAPNDGPLPLALLPGTCGLHRFVVGALEAHGVSHAVMHTVSGVGGLNLALAAGLGVTCLNASAVPDDAAPFSGPPDLPTLPEVEFSLVPPRANEPGFVADVRAMLAAQLG